MKSKATPKLLKKSPLHFPEFLKINLNALKIIQYKIPATNKIGAQMNAPNNQKINEPNSPKTIQIIIETTHPSIPPSSNTSGSKLVTSIVGEDGFFHK